MAKIEKEIPLDLTDIPFRKRTEAKRAVANFIENETLLLLEQGKSPVQGETFDKLTKEYADREKGGRTTPNLSLEGDLKEAFDVFPTTIGVKMQVDDSQSEKADGHNQLTARAKAWAAETGFPKRRYIPGVTQKLKPSIMKEANNILDEFREEGPERVRVTDRIATEDITSVTIDEIFGIESIITRLQRELGLL